MAVLANTTLLFSKAAERRDTAVNDTFSPLDGALQSSGCLREASVGSRQPDDSNDS